MDPFVRQTYLETSLRTATPQQLRLMLIQGAIRQTSAAREHLVQGQQEEWFDSLVRGRDILAELLSSVQRNGSPLTEQVRSLYVFLLQRMSDAQRDRATEPLDEVLRILDEERTTWTQLCAQMPEAPDRSTAAAPQEIVAPQSTSMPLLTYGQSPGSFSGGASSFSFDA